jgi:hypothetical protein
MLPDLVLLNIFDFYVHDECGQWGDPLEAWHTLVHVCREWRTIVFGSPRRLELRLLCRYCTPVKEGLDNWPPLPIVIRNDGETDAIWDMDNLIAALEHNDRVQQLCFVGFPSRFLKTLQRPFPALTHLELQYGDESMLVDPDSFLGGSAPSLRTLLLDSIPFPGLPKLLQSTTHLTHLSLWAISSSGYISPDVMLTALSTLTSLERLWLEFELPIYPDLKSRRPPLPTRIILPFLTELLFSGACEYLECLVAWLDAPLLDKLDVTFFHQLIFDTLQLTQFISRTPKLKAYDESRIHFSDWNVSVTLTQTSDGSDRRLHVQILRERSPEDQLSPLVQVCSSSFPHLISGVNHLHIIEAKSWGGGWQGDFESSPWLEFLHPFTSVKGLHISQEFAPRIAFSLQDLVGERVTEVLPALETLFLETPPLGLVQEAIGKFATARQLSNHPIVITVSPCY